MSFYDKDDLKFWMFMVFVILFFVLVFITVNSIVKNPYEKCAAFCEGRNDKLTSFKDSTFPVECSCLKDVEKYFNFRDKPIPRH